MLPLPLPVDTVDILFGSDSDTDSDSLTDDSIIDVYENYKEKMWIATDPFQLGGYNESVKQQNSICTSSRSASIRQQIKEGIQRGLNFHGSHIDLFLQDSNPAAGLSFIKAVDNQYGKPFQKAHPISDWITKICDQVPEGEEEFCIITDLKWKQREGHIWKSVDSIANLSKSGWDEVGLEKDDLWGELNAECQFALVERCEVPYICERTLYDPIPRSQYFLTHQLLQRIMTEQFDCPGTKHLLSEEVNDQLCSKMYQEATLISQMGYPSILRDIFSEYVGFCGYMRYPNFFREDWIENLLSWQSKSDYGCFVFDPEAHKKFWSSDTPIKRRRTLDEEQNGLDPDEYCLPHFTAVALSALAASWDFMEANCGD